MSQITEEEILGSMYECGAEPQIIQDMHLSKTDLLHVYSKIESFRRNGTNPDLPDLFVMIYSTLHEKNVIDPSILNLFH